MLVLPDYPWIRARLEWYAPHRPGSWGPLEGHATMVCAQLAAASPVAHWLSANLLLSTLLAGCLPSDLGGLEQVAVFECPPNGWATLTAGPPGEPAAPSRPGFDPFVDRLVTAEWRTAREREWQKVLVPPGELPLEQRIVNAVPAHLDVQADRVGSHLQLVRRAGLAAVLLKVVLALADGDLVVTLDRRL